MRPESFSRNGCRTVSNIDRNRDRVVAAWNVATSGPSWIMQVSSDRLGGAGSCTWTTSKSPSRSQRRTRAADTRPNCSRATEPLYGNRHRLAGHDDVRRQAGRVVVAGREHRHVVAELDQLSRPGRARAPARLRGCPRSTGRRCRCAWRAAYPDRLPSGGLRRAGRRARAAAACASPPGARAIRCGEHVGERLRRRRAPARAAAPPAASIGGADRTAPSRRRRSTRLTGSSAAPVVAASSAGPPGIRVGSPKNCTSMPLSGQVAVGDQADDAVGAQPFGQHRRRAAAQPPVSGDHLHAEALAVGDEAVEQRLGLEPLGHGRERMPLARSARSPQRPSCPMCGKATIDALAAHAPPRRGCLAPVVFAPARATTSRWSIFGSRNVSSQYRRTSAAPRRRAVHPQFGVAGGRTTRRRFLRSCCAPPPLRTVAASATARNARWRHGPAKSP